MSETKQFGEILTLQETAEYLKLSRPTIYLYVRAGKLPAKKLGNRWRFSKEALKKFMEQVPEKQGKGDAGPPLPTG